MTAPREHADFAARQSLTDELRLTAKLAASYLTAAADTIENLREQLAEAQREAVTLAQYLYNAYYSHEPDYASGKVKWEPCDTPAGVITQIDNMVAGVCTQLATVTAERDALRTQLAETQGGAERTGETRSVGQILDAADAALASAAQPAAVPPEGFVVLPVELVKRVQESLGEFLMDHGWSQRDMDTSDEFGTVLLAAALSAQAHEAAPTMDDAIAAGDGTLHGAIDHWMHRALDAERVLLSRGLVLEEAAKVCEEREQRFNREDARAACRLCAKGIRALADQINAAIGAAKGEPS